MGNRLCILVVVGTRPEAIKMAPVVRALEGDGRFVPILCATGQHRTLLADALAAFGLAPDVDLELMEVDQQPAALAAAVLTGIDEVIRHQRPAWVLVQGDTVTTLAAAQAAFYARTPLAHVEAGLRSGDRGHPFPEEGNRCMVASIADLHFAPTPAARDNLLAAGVNRRSIHVTGNTAIDALLMMAEAVRMDQRLTREMTKAIPTLAPGRARGRRVVLVTAHRRESLGEGITRICAAVARLTEREDIEIVWPVHPNPHVHAAVRRLLGGHRRIHLIAPLDYRRFVWLLRRVDLVLTDSGGLQEEAPALGKPVLVMRAVTERPEALAAGATRLVGTDPTRILSAVARLLDDPAAYAAMAKPRFPFGDGHAAERIVQVLAKEKAKTVGWSSTPTSRLDPALPNAQPGR